VVSSVGAGVTCRQGRRRGGGVNGGSRKARGGRGRAPHRHVGRHHGHQLWLRLQVQAGPHAPLPAGGAAALRAVEVALRHLRRAGGGVEAGLVAGVRCRAGARAAGAVQGGAGWAGSSAWGSHLLHAHALGVPDGLAAVAADHVATPAAAPAAAVVQVVLVQVRQHPACAGGSARAARVGGSERLLAGQGGVGLGGVALVRAEVGRQGQGAQLPQRLRGLLRAGGCLVVAAAPLTQGHSPQRPVAAGAGQQVVLLVHGAAVSPVAGGGRGGGARSLARWRGARRRGGRGFPMSPLLCLRRPPSCPPHAVAKPARQSDELERAAGVPGVRGAPLPLLHDPPMRPAPARRCRNAWSAPAVHARLLGTGFLTRRKPIWEAASRGRVGSRSRPQRQGTAAWCCSAPSTALRLARTAGCRGRREGRREAALAICCCSLCSCPAGPRPGPPQPARAAARGKAVSAPTGGGAVHTAGATTRLSQRDGCGHPRPDWPDQLPGGGGSCDGALWVRSSGAGALLPARRGPGGGGGGGQARECAPTRSCATTAGLDAG